MFNKKERPLCQKHFLPLIAAAAIFWMCDAVSAQSSPAQPDPPALELGRTLEGDIGPGRKQRYQITAEAGQYIIIRVQSSNVKFAVTKIEPGGGSTSMLSPPEYETDVRLDFVTGSAGSYIIEIYTWRSSPEGHFNIGLVESRAATERERSIELARSAILEGIHYRHDGKFTDSEKSIRRGLEIRERLYGPDDAAVAEALTFLSLTYFSAEDYVSAIDTRMRALKITEKLLGKDHSQVAQLYFEIGTYYIQKGDVAGAEPLILRSLDILQRTNQSETIVGAYDLEMLGEITYDRGDRIKANDYFRQALAIDEKIFGPSDPHLLDILLLTGHAALDSDDARGAEAIFTRALDVVEKNFGPNDWNVPLALNGLGRTYCLTGNFDKAEDAYNRALSVNSMTGAAGTERERDTYFGLARLYAAKGLTDRSADLQTRASDDEERYISRNLIVGSEREKLAYLTTLSPLIDDNVSLHLQIAPNNTAFRDLALTTILRRKGRVQDFIAFGNEAALARLSPDDRRLVGQFNEATSKLSNLALRGPELSPVADFQKQIKDLGTAREQLEGEIAKRNIRALQQPASVVISSIQKLIPAGSALVEFVVYRPYDIRTARSGDPRYAVYTLKSGAEIGFKDLGDAKPIDLAVASLRQALRDPHRVDVKTLARTLDEKVMRPVRALIGDTNQLLLSPDGELNVIPFGALVDESGKFLVERTSFTYLSSGRDLLRMKEGRSGGTSPVIIGNPDFGVPPSGAASPLGTSPSRSRSKRIKSVAVTRDLSDTYFAPLSGSEQEGRSIKTLFPDAKFLTGTNATETSLKDVAAPRILHIATHGFFLESPASVRLNHAPVQGMVTHMIDDPLLRSGLALAGANRRSAGNDDGLLTALEASGLDLWGTELVVLSACDTGLGEVRNGDGVYGLRRAFGIAGAESIVMSLWPVSDQFTRDMMVKYYKGLKDGRGRGEALRSVELELIKRPGRSHPFYWASFIQSGNWTPISPGK